LHAIWILVRELSRAFRLIRESLINHPH